MKLRVTHRGTDLDKVVDVPDDTRDFLVFLAEVDLLTGKRVVDLSVVPAEKDELPDNPYESRIVTCVYEGARIVPFVTKDKISGDLLVGVNIQDDYD